jgi:hypothetical protein
MKKQLIAIFAAAVVILSAACSGGDSPKGVANEFLTSLNKMDFAKAKTMGTEETGKLLDMLSSFSDMVPDSVKQKEANKKIEIVNEKIEGDNATVTYKTEGSDKEETLKLVKADGKWKVQMSKADMGGGEEEMEDAGGTTSDTMSTDTAAPAGEGDTTKTEN